MARIVFLLFVLGIEVVLFIRLDKKLRRTIDRIIDLQIKIHSLDHERERRKRYGP